MVELGAPLHSVLGTLRAIPSSFPKIEVSYSQDSPLKYPVVVDLEVNGLRLQFDGREQTLRVIEVLEWGKMKITYKGAELGKQGVLSFKTIYSKVFGPAYPGVYNKDLSVYILSYPGVAFTFTIPEDLDPFPASSDEFIKYLSGQSVPSCDSMAIFKGNSWPEARDELFKPSYLIPGWKHVPGTESPPASSSSTSSSPPSSTPVPIGIDYVSLDPPSNVCSFTFESHPRGTKNDDIEISKTTMQDVIMMLGPPSERLFKQDSRLSIHNPSDGDEGTKTDLFFNYFALGVDICFDTRVRNPPVKKIIFHGNVPGSLPFQKYRRCRWRFADGVTSEQPFQEYASDYTHTTNPMMLNRAIESPSSSLEIVGELDDMPEPAVEDWGLTDLYGAEGCVFEVLKNGSVVSLTVY